MGLFDSVYAPCAHCGAEIEYQSKADEDACLNRYTVETAPTHILADVLNSPEFCRHCEKWTALYDPKFPPEQPRPRPDPTPKKVRDPEAGEISIHRTQKFLRWWKAPFTRDDIEE